MTLDEYFRIGETVEIGSYTFTADRIREFARKHDPQDFHIDDDLAARSVLGGLCASGWHTASAWMKCNLESSADFPEWDGPGPAPEFGPSPGFRNLKWLKPVYAGQTVRYTRRCVEHRPLASRPGWRILSLVCEGFDATGDKVISFDSAVLVKTG
jgi:acyl dehydratase